MTGNGFGVRSSRVQGSAFLILAVISVVSGFSRTASAQAVDVASGTTRMQLIVDNPKGELMTGAYANVRLELPHAEVLPLMAPDALAAALAALDGVSLVALVR